MANYFEFARKPSTALKRGFTISRVHERIFYRMNYTKIIGS